MLGKFRDALATVDRHLQVSDFVPDKRNAVLAYHSVGTPGEYGNVSVDRFRRDLAYLTTEYEVVDLPEVLDRPASGEKHVAITFDDAHENFFTNALPVIREFELPATVFVVADAIGDPRGHVNVCATMDAEQLQTLVAGDLVTIGNHTLTHPNLSAIDDEDQLRAEIIDSREQLAARLDTTIDRFCFPSGTVSTESLALVRESHALAVTTLPETLGKDVDPHQIPRITAHYPQARVRWQLTDLDAHLRNGLNQVRDAVF